MTNEFNQIRDAYHRNMFNPVPDAVDAMSIYKDLADIHIVNEQEENLFHLAARFTDPEAIRF
ncbi:hypothetical protein ACFJIV_21865 [Mucilaginibacter sp. UC70_90]